MRCRGCGYTYFHNCAAAAAAIIETGGGLILVRRAGEPRKGFLDLPGGFADYGESLETAATREVREELGLEIQNLAYLGSFPNRYVFRGVTYFTADAVFTARTVGTPKIRGKAEISAFAVFRPEEIIPGRLAFGSIRQAIKKYLYIKYNK